VEFVLHEYSGCHPLRGLLTAAALLGTLPHHLVVPAHAFAALGTSPADVGADTAGEVVTFRASEHEISFIAVCLINSPIREAGVSKRARTPPRFASRREIRK
jgi:hypothetical protein